MFFILYVNYFQMKMFLMNDKYIITKISCII